MNSRICQEDALNPYSLLGVTIASSPAELRANYYQLALLCHPDRGGNRDDMVALHTAYEYVRAQLEHANGNPYAYVDGEALDYATFAQEHVVEAAERGDDVIPTYREIWEQSDERNRCASSTARSNSSRPPALPPPPAWSPRGSLRTSVC